ncbi:MAG TPA: TlpA disulfide reductase family protein, partial [Hyphomicrobiaceae bacterium]|nr:TlpA disulfide reductase family protein [Hyphomicrobiaceae bacterium]
MSKTRSVSTASYVSVALLSALAGFAAIYVTLGRPDNVGGETARVLPQGLPAQHAQDQPAGLPAGPGVNPLSTGQMAAFVFKKAPEPLPDVLFLDGAGVARSVNDWRGKVVLLNLWATWCAPCRKEMPALDRLQATLGSDQFEVVALSIDRAGLEGAKKFLEQIKVQSLKLYADPTAKIGSQLKVAGLPATLLLDRQGREIGRLTGPAGWDSEE